MATYVCMHLCVCLRPCLRLSRSHSGISASVVDAGLCLSVTVCLFARLRVCLSLSRSLSLFLSVSRSPARSLLVYVCLYVSRFVSIHVQLVDCLSFNSFRHYLINCCIAVTFSYASVSLCASAVSFVLYVFANLCPCFLTRCISVSVYLRPSHCLSASAVSVSVCIRLISVLVVLSRCL